MVPKHNKDNHSQKSDVIINFADVMSDGVLTHKQLELHGCVLSTVVTDALMLKHQAISIHSADLIFFFFRAVPCRSITVVVKNNKKNDITFWQKYPVVLGLRVGGKWVISIWLIDIHSGVFYIVLCILCIAKLEIICPRSIPRHIHMPGISVVIWFPDRAINQSVWAGKMPN